MKFANQCEECQDWIHHTCSALPLYLLLCLAKTIQKYTCESCSFDKYADTKWPAVTSETISRMKEQTAHSSANTDMADPRCPQATASPPLTDVAHDDMANTTLSNTLRT